ncbi:hypothetical protein HYC85_005720 [Camellia sinensis]|uniref:Uncharacterized protein n=1 Tax=Camellia sinensis TaxID=4442 RepID=A0A7J7I164_CAMSI|nr:hypothetical protein HYC85_005720 [Camellia sinensis]
MCLLYSRFLGSMFLRVKRYHLLEAKMNFLRNQKGLGFRYKVGWPFGFHCANLEKVH